MREIHPYGGFIPKNATAMMIGSFPIGKFTDPKRRIEIKPHEFDFYFGGDKNLLWKLLGQVFDLPVATRDKIRRLVVKNKLAVGDLIISCCRKNGGASDVDLYDIHWNAELLKVIRKNKIKKVYFTSKKLKKWFTKLFPESEGMTKITLISPSAQSVRSLVKRSDFRTWFKANPKVSKFEFILLDYKHKSNSDA